MTRQAQDIAYPETAEEFWVLVEANKDDLQALIAKYHPIYMRVHRGRITAPLAKRVCEAVRKDIMEDYQGKFLEKTVSDKREDPQQKFRDMLNRKDPTIDGLFNEVWFGMPESMESRNAKGFDILCLLCEGIPEEEEAA